MNFFDRANAWMENVEGSAITLVTTFIPWLAPALPAFLTYSHLTTNLDVPIVVAVAMAATVEFLGLAAVSTAFQYMRHNKVNKAEKNKVNLGFPVVAYLFYLAVLVTVNVLPEIPWINSIFVRAASITLLTLISAPAFVITVSRQQTKTILEEKERNKLPKLSGNLLEISKTSERLDWRNLSLADKTRVFELSTTKEIMNVFGVSDRTARNWKTKANEEFKK